jgi:hypothetical protein
MRIALLFFIFVLPSVCRADVPTLITTLTSCLEKDGQAKVHFQAGVADWQAGHVREARNHWVRSEGWLRQQNAPAATLLSLRQLVLEVDRTLFPERDSVAADVPETPAPRPARRRRRARRNEMSEPASVESIMDSARRAADAGEKEKAVRLLRIAAGLPGGENAAARADELERELLQPAR